MSELPYTQIECKKDALRQMQTGEWKISLTVQHADMPPELLSAPMGQRMIAVLIALRGDEEPKPGEIFGETGYTKGSGPKDKTAPKSEGARAVQRAAILCDDMQFRTWVATQSDYGVSITNELAADFIRGRCNIKSRRDLAVDPVALEKFHTIEVSFKYRDQVGR